MADGRTTSYQYDPMGRTTAQVRPDGSRVAFAYDKSGNMTSLVTPSGTHAFGSSNRGLPTTYTTPLSGSYSLVYDGAKRLKSVTSPSGSVITNSFDANGLLTGTAFPGGEIDTIRGKCGRVFGYARGSETASLTYDGSLLTGQALHGSVVDTMAWTYNTDFAPTSFSYSGATQTYGYDADGLLTSAAPFTISRDASSGLAVSVTTTGFALARAYNVYGEIDAASSAAYAYALTRDAAGRIASRTETASGVPHTWAYAYDTLGRLTSATRDGVLAESYAYDANGNRTSYRAPLRGIATSQTSTFDAEDRCLTSGSETLTFTADGYIASRTSSGLTTSYAYTALGELSAVTPPSGPVVSYRYDAHGSRVAKLVGGVVTERYEWAGPSQLLAVYDGSGALQARFLYADARVPYAVDELSGRYFLAYDQAGSLRAVTDSSGTLVRAVERDSFGNVISDTAPGLVPWLGFAGGLSDAVTGLTLFGARDYDPALGRWLAKDPIGFAGGDADLYGYCLGDPVNEVDPSGLLLGGLVDAGEGYGTQAVDYWAERSIDPNNSWWQTAGYTGMGLLSALWTPCTSDATFVTLFTAGFASGGGEAAAAADSDPEIAEYRELRKVLKGTGIEAHHLIEKRFAELMGQQVSEMLSIAVEKGEHQALTNAWRALIPYGESGTGAATVEQVMNAARQIYSDSPAILKALGL